ncbi:hypothetical protein [Bradyrhizobium sp. 930_D9_N1_4]|uniref:hypothetical protein n=1 Tax=Bradyrhizobium sp. 930_D9_N1_4 TaxID=3240374 RepID=UPI003F8CAAE8
MSIFYGHHIILERFRGHQAFRDMDKEAFDIDSPANRIYLPGDIELASRMNVSPHPSRHVLSYVEGVCRALNRIAAIPDSADRAVEIRTLIDAMRVGFVNGDLYTNMPIGKTREEVDLGNARVLADHKAYLGLHPDQLASIKDLEQRGRDAGMDHLIKWLLYLDNPERQKLLAEVMDQNPGVNVTSGNRDLDGTPWRPKAAAVDPSSGTFQIPGSTPVNPNDFPPLQGYNSPPYPGQNEPEGFRQSDPRFTGALPAFPAPDPNERRLGQLPPSTAMPPPPLVLQFNSETGDLLKRSDGSPLMGPDPHNLPHDPSDVPAVLRGMALFGAATAAPALWPLLPALAPILGLGWAGATAARAEPTGNIKGGPSATEPSPNAPLFHPNGRGNDRPAGSRPATFEAAGKPFDQAFADAGTFADRFGNWIDTPAGTMSAQDVQVPTAPAAGAAPPEEVRRLTRVNAANAGSVFASGSAPVPYLPSTEFNDRFGHWTTPTAYGQPPQTGRPIGTFADEPGYGVPPPIFGTDDPGNPRNSAEEWFSRWIGPLLRP